MCSRADIGVAVVDPMRVRLTRKLAECIDGVDLAGHTVGDVLDLMDRDALCLLAEGWAVPEAVDGSAHDQSPAFAALPDGAGRHSRKRL